MIVALYTVKGRLLLWNNFWHREKKELFIEDLDTLNKRCVRILIKLELLFEEYT